MVVDCPTCGKRVPTTVVGGYQYHDPSEGGPCRITLLSCERCQHPILVREEDLWEGSWSSPHVVHPRSDDYVNPNIPEELRAVFREARVCFRCGALTASAIMCRKALEGMCALHEIKSRNLATALEKAKISGVIDGQLIDWAEELRLAGNEAAHEVEPKISGEDTRDLLDLTEAILEHVYVFRHRFDAFRRRRRGGDEAQKTDSSTPGA